MSQVAPALLSECEVHTAAEARAVEGEVAGRSPTQIAMSRLRGDKVAVICLLFVLLIFLAAIFAPVICDLLQISHAVDGRYALDINEALGPYNYPLAEYGPPYGDFTMAHPLGIAPSVATDNLAVMLYGLRVSLIVATAATVGTTILGVALGMIAGFCGGVVDAIISFAIDLLLSFPFLLFALATAPIIAQRFATDTDKLHRVQFISLIVLLTVFGWMWLARLVRGEVLQLREREYILAAQVLGASTVRILLREVLPNLVSIMVTVLSLSFPGFIAAEVGLSYLGIGINGSLGQLISDATHYYDTYPIFLWAPATVLTVMVIALSLLGDSIADAFDPKSRR